MHVNNAFYEAFGEAWWDDEAMFEYASLRYCVNPVRYRYFRRCLGERGIEGGSVLDVGCGGGYLSEAFARDGFCVTAVDPAERSVAAARAHAAQAGRTIDYRVARGEALPFPRGSFDIVACCDVLEHVDDPRVVLSECSRVLKPGGTLFFETVNRTRRSRFVLITLWQGWLSRSGEADLHVWEKFVTPAELSSWLGASGLAPGGMRGISPRRNPLAMAWAFWKIRSGRLRGQALEAALGLHEGGDLGVSYMGQATKAC